MSARFVTIRTITDPHEAEMLKDLLEQEGIPATIQGNTHNALYGGILASALRVPLQVPEPDAERARAILDALETFDPIEPQEDERDPLDDDGDGPGPYRSAPLTSPELPRRKVLVAVAAAVIIPMVLLGFGAGHFYARSHLRGFALLFMGWTALVLLFGRGYTAALFAIPLVILLDAAGAALVIRAQDRARSQA